MTREEVAGAVGGGPGNYARGKLGSHVTLMPRGLGWARYDRWIANDAELLILFGEDGRAAQVEVWDVLCP